MIRKLLGIALVSAALLSQGCMLITGPPAYGELGEPQLFEGMGPYQRKVTTSDAEAQRYFNQGLVWMYSFNHDEAVVSFREAARLDPGCAMAWWGIAQAQGPNYNDPMMNPNRVDAAWEAIERAKVELDNETPLERSMVEALATRYAEEYTEDRTELNEAYSEAMAALHARYPDDPEIATLYAESMMVKHPWKLYDMNGVPAREETNKLVATIEGVLAGTPSHPGAAHLYIHAIEPSNDKARAIPAGRVLEDQIPASGHMLHMPSHIYVQVGMWHEAVEQNRKSMASDDRYREAAPDQLTQHGYMVHNSHMLAFAAMMIGREEDAMMAARSINEDLPWFFYWADSPMLCTVYDVQKRFGRWQELLDEPEPPNSGAIVTATWRAHRAIAHAALGDIEAAKREQAMFREQIAEISPNMGDFYGQAMKRTLASEYFVAAEIALQQDDFDEAIALLKEAVILEDLIGYGEPPAWLQPARHTLGVALLKAGKPIEAEAVYREDLRRWPRNGWSLLGLSQALEAQGKMDEAHAVHVEFKEVWKGADEETTTSCKCVEALGT